MRRCFVWTGLVASLPLAVIADDAVAQLPAASPTAGGVDERLFAFGHELFAHASAHRDVFRAMAGDRGVAVVEQVFQKMLVDLVRDDVKAMTARGGGASMPTETVVQFVGGGLSSDCGGGGWTEECGWAWRRSTRSSDGSRYQG